MLVHFDINHEHVLQGYTLNEKRLQADVARLAELRDAVDVMGRMLAESKPPEKDIICKVIVNLINRENL